MDKPRPTKAPVSSDEGSWIDVYALHMPPPEPRHEGPVREDLGLDGYDRKAGTEVPKHPTLKARGDAKPQADPFGKTGH